MQTTTGIGRALRVERERKRLSLETIARATMVRKDYLEAIDEDHFELLPSGAYAKGFIRAYANYIGVDPVPCIRAYETCYEGASASDLSSSLRMEPVRVPRAVGPRAWRIAFAAAVSMLVLLGMVGALGSDDNPGASPAPLEVALSASSAPTELVADAEDMQTAEILGAMVRVEAVHGRSWVGVHVDGELVFEGNLDQGDKRSWKGKESVYVVLGNARAVVISANGQPLGTPAEDTYRGTFTPHTRELPPSQPQ